MRELTANWSGFFVIQSFSADQNKVLAINKKEQE